MKAFIILLFFVFVQNNVLKAQNTEYIFDIVKIDENFYIKSCIPKEDYNPKIILPRQTKVEGSETHKRIMPPAPGSMILKNAFWQEDCLLINIDIQTDQEHLKQFVGTLINKPPSEIIFLRKYLIAN